MLVNIKKGYVDPLSQIYANKHKCEGQKQIHEQVWPKMIFGRSFVRVLFEIHWARLYRLGICI